VYTATGIYLRCYLLLAWIGLEKPLYHIKPGDLVHRIERHGGLVKSATINKTTPGLVIEEFTHQSGDSHTLSVPQYRVRWMGEEKALWFCEHDLVLVK